MSLVRPQVSPTDFFTASDLVEAAEAETGLCDWGPLAFREALERLVESIRSESRLTPVGLDNMRADLMTSLRTRLRLQAEHAADRRIAAVPIAAPIIIVGLPRSGTTNLHSLLAQDPAHRVARTWEVNEPWPAPTEDGYWNDTRIDSVQAQIAGRGMLADEIQAVLPYHATSPAECGAIIDHAFMSQYRQAAARVPAWAHWRDHDADWRLAFEFHRQFLQHLQTNFRAERWLLKSPEHLVPAATLAETYPDAIIIHTHRDPARVLGSVSSLIAALRRLGSDHVDPAEVGREQLDLWSYAIERMMAARDSWADTRVVVDVYLNDIAQAPMATVARIYDEIGVPLGDEARRAMTGFLGGDENAREHKHAYRSSYDLRDFGLAEGEVHERFSAYMQRYGIAPRS